MVSEKTAVKEKLNSYELIIILRPDLAEEKVEAAVENVRKFIAGKGGTAGETQKWGKKRLAYPIKHFGEGSYFLLKFQAKPDQNRELENSLKISEDVLRHLLVKIE
ncbi:MAG: 30S ribosomal protein S6 [Dehalococcoidia bacterium]|nr:30S ribosomal protein S6 [Dehalococcoidia bacterium]